VVRLLPVPRRLLLRPPPARGLWGLLLPPWVLLLWVLLLRVLLLWVLLLWVLLLRVLLLRLLLLRLLLLRLLLPGLLPARLLLRLSRRPLRRCSSPGGTSTPDPSPARWPTPPAAALRC
jgi:hypothetical protein